MIGLLKCYTYFLLYFCIKLPSAYTEIETQQCLGLNEMYLSCGIPCLDTCDNYWIQRICDRECVSGCFCKPGYVRDSNYRCMLPEYCEVRASHYHPEYDCIGLNEELKVCGTACPDTCDRPNNSWICTKQCVIGCYCIPGYVRDSNGNCIKRENCPVKKLPTCEDSMEEYQECGTACPLTCENYGTSEECSRKCVPGCFCKRGLIRDSDWNCILPHHCPNSYIPGSISNPCRKPNEEYGFGSSCPLTCRTLNSTKICPNHPIKGCFCIDGFVRDDRKRCIRPQNCPPVVPEVKLNCISVTKKPPVMNEKESSCETQFLYGNENDEHCKIDAKKMANDATKNCTEVIVNPVVCYGENEIMACGSPCAVTCKNLGKPCNIFSKSCVQQCYCKRGYARDHRGLCIPNYRCPRSNPSILPLIYSFWDE